MNDFRLLYVSKIKSNINPVNDLYDILTEAVAFNSLNEIYGVLYYGNDYFIPVSYTHLRAHETICVILSLIHI
ncbi:BLUF domain-containing protein, partial [Acinetobacter baumannii]|uniref:BLUF domain-containing protein n=1 Tax=Acinetobacter baumannii TaxID=470 RepID=UPI003AFB722F